MSSATDHHATLRRGSHHHQQVDVDNVDQFTQASRVREENRLDIPNPVPDSR